MAVHFITGKLGGGKSLVSVGRIRDYLLSGKKVATNLDINLEHLLPSGFELKKPVYRVPDKPLVSDLYAIGYGTKSKRDEDFGLLVLDELGTWLNSRNYQKDKERQSVIDWFLHARKYGWDVLLIVQDPELLDKQVRISLGEHTCICRRTDRIPIPFLSFFLKTFIGWQPKLPRIHVGSVFYGSGGGAIKVDTWVYRGNSLFKCYDTSQVFCDSPNRISQYLPPHLLKPLNTASRDFQFYMRLTKIYFKRFKVPFVFLAGMTFNIFLLVLFSIYTNGSLASTPSPDVKDQEISVSSAPDHDPAAEPKTEIVYIPLSFVNTFDSSGNISGQNFIYDGSIFTDRTIPVTVKWKGKKPYAIVHKVIDTDNTELPPYSKKS